MRTAMNTTRTNVSTESIFENENEFEKKIYEKLFEDFRTFSNCHKQVDDSDGIDTPEEVFVTNEEPVLKRGRH